MGFLFLYFSWQFRAYGFHDNTDASRKQQKSQKASSKTVKEIMKKEFSSSRSIKFQKANTDKKRLENQDSKSLNSKSFNNKFSSHNQNLDIRDFKPENVKNEIAKKEYDDLLNREIDGVLEQLEKKGSYKKFIDNYYEEMQKRKEKQELQELISELTDVIERRQERGA